MCCVSCDMNPLVMWAVISTVSFGISDGRSVGRKKRVGFVSCDLLYSYLFLGYREMSAEFSQIPSLKCLLVSVRWGVSICMWFMYKYMDIYLMKIIGCLCRKKWFHNPTPLHFHALAKLEMTTHWSWWEILFTSMVLFPVAFSCLFPLTSGKLQL